MNKNNDINRGAPMSRALYWILKNWRLKAAVLLAVLAAWLAINYGEPRAEACAPDECVRDSVHY